jgi:hypothetical protein
VKRPFAALLTAALIASGGGAAAQRKPDPAAAAQAAAALDSFTSPTLTRFSGEAEFDRYAQAVHDADDYSALRRPVRFAQVETIDDVASDVQEPVCPETDPACVEAMESADITVTGSVARPSNPSITNNQMRSVEEGDIVKQIDHSLLILQDGRIFVVDIRAKGRKLAVTDRANVYRSADEDMWYDEMLVFGDRVLVTGYSYEDEETELAIFRLGGDGRLVREGVFRMSSNDYYSTSNYATRLIGDSLVVYTPLEVDDLSDGAKRWPVVRRWREGEDREDEEALRASGSPLLDARTIYRPVRSEKDPTVHTVSVCPLGAAAERGNLECRTSAVTGPGRAEWYVTESDVYLWLVEEDEDSWPEEDCTAASRQGWAETHRALLYRLPVSGAAPSVLGVRGSPPDQFAMQADAARFHALLNMASTKCNLGSEPTPVGLFTVPLTQLSATLSEAPEPGYAPLPPVAGRTVTSRFTDRHLVYGGLSRYRGGLPVWDEEDQDEDWVKRARTEQRAPAFALALDRPARVRTLDVRHTVIRAERVGDDIVLTGYRDKGGLMVTMVGLKGTPGIAGQLRLRGRHESEGRSHAFNSIVERDGSGTMGLPTEPNVSESDRAYWRSTASDLSFIEFGPDGAMSHAGELVRRYDYDEDGDENGGVAGYKCEVSCIDWYGNSRPIFTEGRLFGLSGTELIEGRIEDGRVREVQRLNIALARPPAR